MPASYKTIAEQVLVSPEYKRLVPVPATYKTVEERVMVSPEDHARRQQLPGSQGSASRCVPEYPDGQIPGCFTKVTTGTVL